MNKLSAAEKECIATLWQAGYSANAIAVELSASSDRHVTRCQVSGVLWKQGLDASERMSDARVWARGAVLVGLAG